MTPYFQPFLEAAGASVVDLDVRFDAARDTPELFDTLTAQTPVLREIVAGLRTGGIPSMASSHVGSFGNFLRLPNHYRSISFVVPGGGGESNTAGVIVFKGTEPLLPDFPEYLEWMLRVPFRSSVLPLGLHFPLDMKLPPGAMWIEECVSEQKVTSGIQREYLARYGRLARLPAPLFVFELRAEQVERYRRIVRARLSPAAFSRIEAKVSDGLGVEIYYYPSLPVRAIDLLVPDVRKAFNAVLRPETLEATFNDWIQLVGGLLTLGYMPFAPWNHGMGAYVDPGNACIDGGFNDLLTIVPFDSVPGEYLFWRALGQSIQMLATSVLVMCSAATNSSPPSQSETLAAAVAYITEGLRERIEAQPCNKEFCDPRLLRFFKRPSLAEVFSHLRETQHDRSLAQFRRPQHSAHSEPEPAVDFHSVTPEALGA